MSTHLTRGLEALELLSRKIDGVGLEDIAATLQIPLTAADRMMKELIAAGFVMKPGSSSLYVLTLRLATLALGYLGGSGISELVQPTLDKLALATGELARMSVVEGERIIWVAKAQGARGSLRYDVASEPGEEVRLWASSNGFAWLSTLSDDEAVRLVTDQGIGQPGEYGPDAPRDIADFKARLAQTRQRGYAAVHEVYEVGTSGIAIVVRSKSDRTVIGTVSLAGPEARMKPERMLELFPLLLDAAATLSLNSAGIRAAAR